MLKKIFGLISPGKKGKVSKKATATAMRKAKKKASSKAEKCEFC